MRKQLMVENNGYQEIKSTTESHECWSMEKTQVDWMRMVIKEDNDVTDTMPENDGEYASIKPNELSRVNGSNLINSTLALL